MLSPCQNNVSHEQPFAFQKYLKRVLCVTCSYLILSFYKHDLMRTPHCELWGIKRIGALSRNEVSFGESHILRLRVSSISLIGSSHKRVSQADLPQSPIT